MEQVNEKFLEEWCTESNDEESYETIILHVETNHLGKGKTRSCVMKVREAHQRCQNSSKYCGDVKCD